MYLQQYIRHPSIQPFTKQIETGDFLFRQGESGGTMYVILDGVVQLFDESGENTILIGTYGPGQFFGEKSILAQKNFQRHFSAQARLKTLLLEFTLNDITLIQSVIPDFMLMLFQAASQKLDNAYALIRLLQSHNNMERLIHCIVYFYRCPGLTASSSRLVSIRAEDIHNLIKMDVTQIQDCLLELSGKSILTKGKDGGFTLTNERALMQALEEYRSGQVEAA